MQISNNYTQNILVFPTFNFCSEKLMWWTYIWRHESKWFPVEFKMAFSLNKPLVNSNHLICILSVTFFYSHIWIYIHTSWRGVFSCIPTDKVDFCLLPNDISVHTKIKADKITEIWLWATYWLWTNLCYLNGKWYLRIIYACACVCVFVCVCVCVCGRACACVCVRADVPIVCTYEWKWVTEAVCGLRNHSVDFNAVRYWRSIPAFSECISLWFVLIHIALNLHEAQI